MSSCECTSVCDTGYLPPSWTGKGILQDMRPFQTTGKCCIPCSGFYASDGTTDPRDYGIQYVSVDDGEGGYIETCSGACGLKYPTSLPTRVQDNIGFGLQRDILVDDALQCCLQLML